MGLDGDKYSHSLLEMFSVLKNAYLFITRFKYYYQPIL